ncbi:MAG: LysM peptidoglycan-binding domain-containing protein [Saprospiraceae bacterium]|nr:LysM peptidoglycan-binding domain-containing protein [Saprospiraceae bacterium]
MKNILQIWVLNILLSAAAPGLAQQQPQVTPAAVNSSTSDIYQTLLDNLSQAYPFLLIPADTLSQAEALDTFWDKLAALERGERNKVHILHIGDSHIQADFYSGKVRSLLQKQFGSAGRGLVFPYKLARTNGPNDYRCSSNAVWEYRRRTYGETGPPMGICGIGLRTVNQPFLFELNLKIAADTFDKVTVFYPKSASAYGLTPGRIKPGSALSTAVSSGAKRYHKIKSGETLSHIARRYGTSVRTLQRLNGLRTTRIRAGQRLVVSAGSVAVPKYAPDAFEPIPFESDTLAESAFSSVFTFATSTNSLAIKGEKILASQKESHLHGILLENTAGKGVLYSSVGVNGATSGHYNQAEYFAGQLSALAPDLIIVSLGTNEALGGRFNEAEIVRELDKLLTTIHEAAPGAAILLSTNPDALRRRRYLNAPGITVKNIIKQAAEKHGAASWDLHAVMGGQGSIRRWRTAQLAQSDYVHLTRRGYEVQGELLFAALMREYASRN